MSIYMVQHAFSKPEWEQEWNEWYAGNLLVLMKVPGFITGQRFKALEGTPPRYMAMYTVASPEVFESAIYTQSGGGGTASQRFRPAYSVWIRNLFEGLIQAPEVLADEVLLVLDGPEVPAQYGGVKLQSMQTTGFHRTTPARGLGVVKRSELGRIPASDKLIIYESVTHQQGFIA